MTEQEETAPVGFGSLFKSHALSLTGTWLLVIVEASLAILFPLFIGIAIDDLLNDGFFGMYLLGGLALSAVFTGALRRYYDTRVYSAIYRKFVKEVVGSEHQKQSNISTVTARTNMATEFVEFLENSLPEIINCLIGLLGTLILIGFLQIRSFFACLIATMLIAAIYTATSRWTFELNQGANDEAEKRVDVLSTRNSSEISKHFHAVTRWNIRLSDLETLTFSGSWIILIVLLLYSVYTTVQSGVSSHGNVLAILMYVFAYMESVIILPLFYQQLVRLREISSRLAQPLAD